MPAIVNFLQKHWRGTLARKFYRRLKAANKIAMYFKKYKARQYVGRLWVMYGGAGKRMGDYGRSLKWPVAGNSFVHADIYMKEMYTR